ncbi:Uncharacterised protein [Candidatus Venteria ishoeyi]|uniref:Uncharacterized protein n=1 Tax=Candidatus Venteria ishoeyi TaxID=1899563 RepID=A0A1H6F6S5_9GAMM|nr:Uncharacterised protein [Candidatus Venteria ishoeyi]
MKKKYYHLEIYKFEKMEKISIALPFPLYFFKSLSEIFSIF